MIQDIEELQSRALAELQAAMTPDGLETWRIAYIGPKGALRGMMPRLKDVSAGDKPAVGAKLNAVKTALEEAFKAKQEQVAAGAGGKGHGQDASAMLDMTEPGLIDSRGLGRRHIVMRVREELVEVFGRMGFEVASGPELEDDEHNFVKLNIPPEHPAREASDNFYVDDPAKVARPRMLRSQTSTVQIRVMEEMVRRGGGKLKEAIRVIAPGRVYRPDTVDATHSFMFHQIEGLAVDRGLTMADLKTTLLQFARAYFGPGADVRLRPSFFPFTEPSAELDMMIALRPGEPARWIELGGCGMVDPAVFQACGIDPEEWTGFAFGFGIERIAMGKYGIPDIRMLFENDVRFLSQI
jgi:phenylalanyl-tRNA synthetase alpha chain